MTDDGERESVDTVKYYTRARKFPQLLGRLPDGTKIPGGPYTVQQLIAAIAIIVVGGMSIDTWGVFGFFGNIAILFGAAFGAVFVIGRLPMNGRNPFLALVGLYRAVNSPATGRYQGRPIRLRRPRRVTHRTNVYLGELPGAAPAAETAAAVVLDGASDRLRRRIIHRGTAATQPELAPAANEASPPTGPLSSVQALLALAGEEDSTGNDRHKVVR